MPDEADIKLISDKNYFVFKPNAIYIPFGLDPEKLKFRLDKPLKPRDIEFIQAGVRELDPDSRLVGVEGYKLDDYKFHYDYLVVATGAGMRPQDIPGLAENAHTVWTIEAMLKLRATFDKLVTDAREEQSSDA